MLFLVYLAAAFAATDAMVCFKGICDHIQKPDSLECEGGIIKNGGFCRCFDVCAKVEGEICEAEAIRGRRPLGVCDEGLICQHEKDMFIGAGHCVKPTTTVQSPQARSTEQTLCEQRRRIAMISMVVYRGQWFPKCDDDGLFMPQQCDNTGTCFCVDTNTGVVDESSKVQGTTTCVQ